MNHGRTKDHGARGAAGAPGIVGATLVLSEAIPRLMQPEAPYAPGMIVFAVIGIAVNGAAVLRLRGKEGLNARVVALHLVEDVLGWAAILAVSVLLLFFEAPVLDPLLSIVITLYVLINVMRNLRRILLILLQATPKGLTPPDVRRAIESVEGVCLAHHMHIWSLDGTRHVLTVHVVVGADADRARINGIKTAIRGALNGLGIDHATIEVETTEEHDEAPARKAGISAGAACAPDPRRAHRDRGPGGREHG